MQANKLTINYEKTNFILFGDKSQKHSMDIFCSQQTISQVDSVKYLGILIDSELKWTSHLENLGKRSLVEPAFYLNSNHLLMCIC